MLFLKMEYRFILVHLGMPHGGAAVRKRKHCGFKLSKVLDTKQCVIRTRNKDLLGLARALVTDLARQEKHPDWTSIRQGRQPKNCIDIRRLVFQKVSVGCPKVSSSVMFYLPRFCSILFSLIGHKGN